MNAKEVLQTYAAGQRKFRSQDLKNPVLYNVNLHGADFTGSNLSGSDLSISDLTSTNLKLGEFEG